ncbi:MAG: signal peptidase II [Shimia sp.]
MRPSILGLLAAGLALAADQVSKAVVLRHAEALSGGIEVVPGFDLVLGRNDGIAFGLLGGVGPWALVGLAAVVVAWLLVAMLRAPRRREAVAYGAVIGGAIGNVADRLQHGAVTDFLDFHVGAWHWPAFNLADVAIVVGVAGIVLLDLLGRRGDAPSRS